MICARAQGKKARSMAERRNTLRIGQNPSAITGITTVPLSTVVAQGVGRAVPYVWVSRRVLKLVLRMPLAIEEPIWVFMAGESAVTA
jgi:hypothetical protein